MAATMLSRRHALAGSAMAALWPAVAWAHHGWSGYGTQDFSLSGTVESATLGNPHGLIKLRAADGVWDVVLGPPSNQRRAGLTEELVPAGVQVTASDVATSTPTGAR